MLLDDDFIYLPPEAIEPLLAEPEDIKTLWCESYKDYECKGCKYYEAEDQVCRFDK